MWMVPMSPAPNTSSLNNHTDQQQHTLDPTDVTLHRWVFHPHPRQLRNQEPSLEGCSLRSHRCESGRVTIWAQVHLTPKPVLFFFLKILFIYLFIVRERGGRDREEEKHQSVASCLTGDQPATQACALTGNRTDDLSLCWKMPNPLSHNGQSQNLHS